MYSEIIIFRGIVDHSAPSVIYFMCVCDGISMQKYCFYGLQNKTATLLMVKV